MKLYTRTGDSGQTGLFGGVRVPKNDLRVEACGALDEANAALGVVRSWRPSPRLDEMLDRLQRELFILGAELACADTHRQRLHLQLIDAEHVACLETDIDGLEAELPPMRYFVLPGGCPAAAQLHVARTDVRRAERRIVALLRQAQVRSEVLVYTNRLSDLLFVMARAANLESGVGDIPWTGGDNESAGRTD